MAIIPLSIFPLLTYVAVLLATGPAALDNTIVEGVLVSGNTVSLRLGDATVAAAALLALADLVSVGGRGRVTVQQTMLRVVALAIHVVVFVAWAPAATSAFGTLTIIAFGTVIATIAMSMAARGAR